ncbi:MAG: hypothetical protein HY720_01405, partial [Planctomycetes bacterium]|nr:hypothetical protein [Planctomycetota bacterium]
MRPIQTWGSLALLVIILIAAIALWRPFRHDPVEVVSSAKLFRHDTGTRLAVRLDVEVLPRDKSGEVLLDQKK